MAIDGVYDTNVKSALGDGSGTVTLTTNGDVLTGKVEALGMSSDIQDGVVKGDSFTCTVEGDTPIGHKKFKVKGKVEGDKLKGRLSAGLIGASFEGTRV